MMNIFLRKLTIEVGEDHNMFAIYFLGGGTKYKLGQVSNMIQIMISWFLSIMSVYLYVLILGGVWLHMCHPSLSSLDIKSIPFNPFRDVMTHPTNFCLPQEMQPAELVHLAAAADGPQRSLMSKNDFSFQTSDLLGIPMCPCSCFTGFNISQSNENPCDSHSAHEKY